MSLAWTLDMKEKAKTEKKALVKLQVQLKHAGGGNYQITGPFGTEQAKALFLLGVVQNEPDKIAKVLEILQAPG